MSWRQSSAWEEFSVLSGDAIIRILCLVVIPYWFDCDIKPNPMSWWAQLSEIQNTGLPKGVYAYYLSAPKLNIYSFSEWHCGWLNISLTYS